MANAKKVTLLGILGHTAVNAVLEARAIACAKARGEIHPDVLEALTKRLPLMGAIPSNIGQYLAELARYAPLNASPKAEAQCAFAVGAWLASQCNCDAPVLPAWALPKARAEVSKEGKARLAMANALVALGSEEYAECVSEALPSLGDKDLEQLYLATEAMLIARGALRTSVEVILKDAPPSPDMVVDLTPAPRKATKKATKVDEPALV